MRISREPSPEKSARTLPSSHEGHIGEELASMQRVIEGLVDIMNGRRGLVSILLHLHNHGLRHMHK